MIVLREGNGARRYPIKSAAADEPVRIARVRGTRAAKARQAAPFNLGCRPQPPIAMVRSDFGYTKFTGDRRGRLCAAMQYGFLFIFQKGIGAAIE